MDALWRARLAVTSAAKGWLCVWFLVLLLWTISSLRTPGHVPLTDWLSILLIWVVSTGIVTLAATILLVVPYVCMRGVDTLLQKPWLIYVESGAIAILASFVLTHFVKPTAETFWTGLKPYLIFALVTSLTSSAFYMQRVKLMSKQRVVTRSD
jgi:hypothetical protein